MTASIIRVFVLAGVLVALFATAPLGQRPEGKTVVQLMLGLLLLGVVVTWQIISVARSPYPRLRAVEAVAISVPLLFFIFASVYFATAQSNPASFNEPLSRFDAVYFTITVFATVGFGDIVAKTETARVMVTIQMIANLVLIGVIAKVLLGTVQKRAQALSSHSADQPPE